MIITSRWLFIFNKNIARIFDVQNKRGSILIVITD